MRKDIIIFQRYQMPNAKEVNTPEYWDARYLGEIEKKLDQSSDPLRWDLIEAQINDRDRVLDVGCGRGKFLVYLLQNKNRNITPYGVDISKVGLEQAHKKDKRIRTTQTIDVLPHNYFDVITIISTLEHFEKPKEMIFKLHDLLKSDGLLVVVLPIGDDEWPEHYKIWQLEDVIELFEEIPCKYKIVYRQERVIPKGWRGYKVHTLLCHLDRRPKKEVVIFINFGEFRKET